MDLIVAHKIIKQLEDKDKREKKEKKKKEIKERNIRKYSECCYFCGQNLIWCICKNNIY